MLGPILEGERVRLEPPRPEYLPVYQRWFADMEVTRYLLYRFPFTAKAEEEWLEQVGKDPHQVMWAIVLRHNGKLIGNTSIEKIDWRNRRGETGIVIGEKEEWGKGCAGESMRLRTRYGFRELGLEKPHHARGDREPGQPPRAGARRVPPVRGTATLLFHRRPLARRVDG